MDRDSATLTDPNMRVPTPTTTGPPGGIAWLRRNVARFCDGPDHGRRRALATRELAELEPGALRVVARQRTTALLPPGEAVDLMSRIARPVPVGTVAAALGVADVDVVAVRTAAAAYPLDTTDAEADRAVTRLVESFGGTADEATAARIGLLVQTCEATAGLIGNAAVLLARTGATADELVARTLRADPPVRATRRQSPDGTVHTVDLTRMPFGTGPHGCPGRDAAVALAAGVLDALRGSRIHDEPVTYIDSPVLRIPVRLTVSR